MKKLNLWLLMCVVTVFLISFSACSEEEVILPEYPDLQTIEVSKDNTAELKFTANTNWTLSSSAMWCKFVNGSFKETSMTGVAGDVTINIEVDDNTSFNSDEAVLTLRMGTDTEAKEIAKIVRPGKERVVELYMGTITGSYKDKDTTYAKVDYFDLKLKERILYKVKANYNFVGKFSDAEDYMDIRIPKSGSFSGVSVPSISAEANQEVLFTLAVNFTSDAQKYPVTKEDNKVMQFVDATDNSVMKSINYVFDGLKNDFMDFEYTNHNVNSPWGWIVDMEGKMFKAGGLMGGTPQEIDSHIDAKITVLNDDFKVMVFVDKGESSPIVRRYENTNNNWSIKANLVEGKKDQITITATKAEMEYTYYVAAIPAAQVKELGEMNSKTIKGIIEAGNYIVMEVSQKNASKASMLTCNNMLMEFTEAEAMKGNFDLVNAVSKFIPDVTQETAVFSPVKMYDPSLPFYFIANLEGWDMMNGKSEMEFYNGEGKLIEDASFEMGMTADEQNFTYSLNGLDTNPWAQTIVRLYTTDMMQNKTTVAILLVMTKGDE